jgi:hypothetical protein
MIQIGTQAVPSKIPWPSTAAPIDAARRQVGTESDLSGPRAGSDEDPPLFVSPPPLPFPRVFPGL